MGSFLVPSVFLDRFNTTRALAFLIPFLHYWTPTPSLHYSQINCLWFFSLLVHFLFVVNWEILFNHPDLPLPLFDPSFTCSNSWTWKMSIFSINELSWNSYLRDNLSWGSFKHITEETKGCSSQVCDPDFSPGSST